ncbi:unnamed protein product [Discosporangium mesarthrocarpum]
MPPPPLEEGNSLAEQLALLDNLMLNGDNHGNSHSKGAVKYKGGGGMKTKRNNGEKEALSRSAIGGSIQGRVDMVLHCPLCGWSYEESSLRTVILQAKAAREAVDHDVQGRDFLKARKALDKWFSDFDAGTSPTKKPSTKRSFSWRGKGSALTPVKLHPMHSLVLETLAPLISCCNYEEDYLSSTRHLHRVILSMEEVLPKNYPVLADFYAAWGEALSHLLERGTNLPKRAREQYTRYSMMPTSGPSSDLVFVLGTWNQRWLLHHAVDKTKVLLGRVSLRSTGDASIFPNPKTL